MDTLLPPDLAANVAEIFGDRGRHWVADLPALVADTCAAWDLTVAGPALPGGTHSYVAPVRHDGTTYVLKVPVLDDENFAECAALRCYAGDGAVRLHRADLTTGALLLERADPGHALLAEYEGGGRELGEVVDLATGVLRRLRRPPTGDLSCPPPNGTGTLAPGVPFPRVRDLARRWAATLESRHDELGRPFEHRLFAEAARLCAEYAEADGPDVLVNRDGHTGNVLSGRGGREWLLIDPKPMVGDAAFDAGHLLWDLLRFEPTRTRARYLVDRIADGLAVDAERVRGWALIRAVDNISWAYAAGVAQPYADGAAALSAT
ncbi:aminoglycoside phosphotransferase family protein [Actinocatenispora rupis]|uniref:Aminoglycoside O-phosphotransferase n=1 Tax=Actinocatenispora rupis TaxID=519421 RepID=A0A8J3NBP6_9ACTN|nr:aminoglycoside phosphotransferase family protein [Actinocatenispora rupis]GID13281.1 aminoglycoside O-phosphotransferase [Actinocatenispora rupis]